VIDIKEFIIKSLPHHPSDLVAVVMRKFQVSRPGVHKHLNQLIATGKVVASGNTRNRIYALAEDAQTRFTIPLSSTLHESDLWKKEIQPLTIHLSKHIREICEYGFSEIVNNAIDHSQGKSLTVLCDFSKPEIFMSISDDGIGIFKKIKAALALETERESILHLSKGKFTTAQDRHSGEGIFFTSRAFDTTIISANHLSYQSIAGNDWLINDSERKIGTQVLLTIGKTSARTLQDVFKNHTDAETFAFSKTRAVVKLSLLPGETFLSRSQAKRILLGLDKFKEVVFDFKGVQTIGQGFADEIFRVFQNKHPGILLVSANANENVDFMLKHVLPEKI
jgi:hypothetical protein